MYSALRWERPAVRSVSSEAAATWVGVGKFSSVSATVGGVVDSGDGLKRATKRFFIDLAAAPDTWVLGLEEWIAASK